MATFVRRCIFTGKVILERMASNLGHLLLLYKKDVTKEKKHFSYEAIF